MGRAGANRSRTGGNLFLSASLPLQAEPSAEQPQAPSSETPTQEPFCATLLQWSPGRGCLAAPGCWAGRGAEWGAARLVYGAGDKGQLLVFDRLGIPAFIWQHRMHFAVTVFVICVFRDVSRLLLPSSASLGKGSLVSNVRIWQRGALQKGKGTNYRGEQRALGFGTAVACGNAPLPTASATPSPVTDLLRTSRALQVNDSVLHLGNLQSRTGAFGRQCRAAFVLCFRVFQPPLSE